MNYFFLVLQERTSEESSESESFKGLMQARTQEFIDEVRSTCQHDWLVVLVVFTRVHRTDMSS